MAMGMMCAVVYLVICLTFDQELQRYCEKLGFILKASRSRKFYMFFISLGLFTAMVVFYYSLINTWTMPQQWIVNAHFNTESCSGAYSTQDTTNLGITGSFNKSSIIFVLIGTIFG